MLVEKLAEWKLSGNVINEGVQMMPAIYHDILGQWLPGWPPV